MMPNSAKKGERAKSLRVVFVICCISLAVFPVALILALSDTAGELFTTALPQLLSAGILLGIAATFMTFGYMIYLIARSIGKNRDD